MSMPTAWATRLRAASWAAIVAACRLATEAIMRSTMVRGVTPIRRNAR